MSTPAELDIEIRAEPCHYVAFDQAGTATALTQFATIVYGWVLANPSGSVAATMNVYDSADGSGTIVMPFSLASSESISDWYGPNGVLFRNAVYANVTAGEVKGCLLFRHVRL